jgi:short-subunit dehydrogenase
LFSIFTIEMQQKIIIVGASSGIGRNLAECYAGRGDKVGITARRNELLLQTKEQFPGLIEYECFDIRGKDNIARLESLVKKLGGMDILIISSGTGEPSKELSWEIDEKTVETNVNGFVEIANWGFNFFIRQGKGSLATISSIAAIRGGSWAPAYGASKAFQSNYFEALSIKAAKIKKDITVTCIEPGYVASRMAQSDKLFWVLPVDKAARRIMRAIDIKKRRTHISLRWSLIARLLKWMPYSLVKKFS